MKKFLKKVAVALLAAALTVSTMSSAAMAAQKRTTTGRSNTKVNYVVKGMTPTVYYVTNASGVNVRQQPTASSTRLGGLYKGNAVVVTGRVYINGVAQNWVRINYNGRKAFIISTYLSKTNPNPTPSGTTYTVKVQKNYLALRSQPVFKQSVEIAKLYNGQTVTLISKYNNTYWYVYVPSVGKYGYVNHNFLV